MIGFLKRQLRTFLGTPAAEPKRRSHRHGRPVALYDAAQTSPRNKDHWSRANGRGPNVANDTLTRQIIAWRARYERDNNPNLNGLSKTLAADLIGTGPRLQLSFEDEKYNEAGREVERNFAKYCDDIHFTEKLRLLVEPRPIDGETFGQFITNELSPNPVKLDLKVMEMEQVATPFVSVRLQPIGAVDGIVFDKYGNPALYHVLRWHPGDLLPTGNLYDEVPASQIVHWYRPSRPGQARGISEFAASLESCGQTRDYANATLTKAQTCANLVGKLKTNKPFDANDEDDEANDIEFMENVPVVEGGLISLPEDWDAEAFNAGTTTTGYKEFVAEKNGELGRPVGAPYNVTVGNSSGYNYSSGRLDHVPYHRLAWIDRERLRLIVLIKLIRAWYEEAILVDQVPAELPPIEEWCIDFQWDAFDSIDPQKDADAWEKLLDLQVTTRTEICASRGLRFRDVIDTLAAEAEYMRSKGLDPASLMLTAKVPPPAAAANPAATDPPADPADNTDPETDGQDA